MNGTLSAQRVTGRPASIIPSPPEGAWTRAAAVTLAYRHPLNYETNPFAGQSPAPHSRDSRLLELFGIPQRHRAVNAR